MPYGATSMETHEVTRLLVAMGRGEPRAEDDLLAILYDELRRRARGLLGGVSDRATLQPTAVVHEAWLKLARGSGVDYQDRQHFVAVACRAMRMVLVDHARSRSALKRGGNAEREFLDAAILPFEGQSLGLVELGEALEDLGEMDQELARIVELRYFGGLTIDETAKTLSVSASTVERGWRAARAWLRSVLVDEEEVRP